MAPDRSLAFSALTILGILAGGMFGLLPALLRADETRQERIERLEKMSLEEKADLQRKKDRFDKLPEAEKQRLHELHISIANDPKAQELSDTIRRYNRWLGTLSAPQRAEVLDERDPAKRIAKIKELMKAQEERRFGEFIREFAETLPEPDKQALFKWFGDFVERNEEHLVKRMPDDVRRRFEDQDQSSRRRDLMRSWSFQYRRHESETPVPSEADIEQLLQSLSEEARKPFLAPEQRQARVIVFMRAAADSRMVPQVSKDQLMEFYNAMKPDDSRKQRLERLENPDELLAELRRYWILERFRGPGGRGGPPPRGGEPLRSGEGRPPRPEGRDREQGEKRPPK
jgi:hypothetical protein